MIGGGGSALPSLEVAHLGPFDAKLLNGFLPIFLTVIKGDTYYLESLLAVLVVIGFYIGYLATAGAAPACPEIHQHIFALTYIVGKTALLVVEVLADKIHYGGSGQLVLIGIHKLLYGVEVFAVLIAVGGQEAVDELRSEVVEVTAEEVYGHMVFGIAADKVLLDGYLLNTQLAITLLEAGEQAVGDFLIVTLGYLVELIEERLVEFVHLVQFGLCLSKSHILAGAVFYLETVTIESYHNGGAVGYDAYDRGAALIG